MHVDSPYQNLTQALPNSAMLLIFGHAWREHGAVGRVVKINKISEKNGKIRLIARGGKKNNAGTYPSE